MDEKLCGHVVHARPIYFDSGDCENSVPAGEPEVPSESQVNRSVSDATHNGLPERRWFRDAFAHVSCLFFNHLLGKAATPMFPAIASVCLLLGDDTLHEMASAAAKQTLRQHRARTGADALAGRPSKWNSGEERFEKDPFAFVTIGVEWRGGKEKLRSLKAVGELKGLLFSHEDLSDEWCDVVAELPHLEELYLCQDGISDHALNSIAGLKDLRSLSLLMTRVTDKGLQHLEDKRKLQWLSLCACRGVDVIGNSNKSPCWR
jgi:hypothetical protein